LAGAGLPGAGDLAGGVFCGGVRELDEAVGEPAARRGVLSARGSMNTPLTESIVVTVATFCESKSIVMIRAVT